ncbi:MAG: hypothetical protein CM15mP74_05160 [Halieaceae bacterium]|nr:MAG: hypothetical protein CM15mP74_05160 [Halieaceae bacterium]
MNQHQNRADIRPGPAGLARKMVFRLRVSPGVFAPRSPLIPRKCGASITKLPPPLLMGVTSPWGFWPDAVGGSDNQFTGWDTPRSPPPPEGGKRRRVPAVWVGSAREGPGGRCWTQLPILGALGLYRGVPVRILAFERARFWSLAQTAEKLIQTRVRGVFKI